MIDPSHADATLPSDADFRAAVQPPQVLAHTLTDEGVYPNNGRLPLLVYQAALNLPERNPPALIEALFGANGWGGSWRNGVYGFHHYHSTAHEVLGVYRGTVTVQLGGEQGVVLSAGPGDLILIPAGVAHKKLGASQDFSCVGAYPRGQFPDMNYGKPGERPGADRNIARVLLPQADPVYGDQGPLAEYWL